MKKIVSLSLVLVLVTSCIISGCSSKATSEPVKEDKQVEKSKETKETKSEEVTIWWSQEEQDKALLESAIKDFHEKNDHIRIKPEYQGNQDSLEKLKVALAGNVAPDIVKIDHVYVQALGYKNQFIDLVTLGANDIKDQYIESTWKANMYKEHVFALPFDANTVAFMYNKDLLKEAGVEPPVTYEALINCGQSINSLGKDDIFAYSVPITPGKSGWVQFQFLSWIWRNGGDVLNEDWTKAIYNSPECVDALQKMIDLVYKEKIVPENVYYEDEFYVGKVGMLDMGCWALTNFEDENKQANLGVVTMPRLKENINPYSGLGLYSLGITVNSENPESAYEFLKYFCTSKQYQLNYAKSHNLMPSLKEAYEDDFYKTDEWQVFMEQLKNTKSRPGTPAWPEIAEHMSVAIQKALTKTSTPQEALDEAVKKSNQVLNNIK